MSKRGETDWQVERSVLQCNQYMLENGIAFDVVFRVCSPEGSSEDIPAHRYVLISRSPVFEALFLGDFRSEGQEKSPIEIADVEPDAFKQLLRYIYYETVTLTPDNVLPVLYAAKKYLLNTLAKKCMDFLEKKITTETVCTILNHSILYEEKELTEKCLAYIAPRARNIIKGDAFLALSTTSLIRFLRNDYLYVNSEVEILDACVKWASGKSNTQNSDVTDYEVRKLLGENLGRIRFSSISPEEFARALGKRNILTNDEKSRFYYYLLTGDDSESLLEFGFDLNHRVQKCHRYPCLGKTAGWWTCNGPGDALSFTVDKPIVLIGASVYGGREAALHNVVLELYQHQDVPVNRTECKVESDGSSNPFPVYFDGPEITLVPKEQYTILALMKGPISYYGQGGTDVMTSRGVTFHFSRSDKSGNGTNIKSGQIPELLFLLPKK